MAAGKVDGAPSMRPGGAEEEEKKGSSLYQGAGKGITAVLIGCAIFRKCLECFE